MTRRRPPIKSETQRKIYNYHKKFPLVPMAEIAEEFNVTYSQVRTAISLGKKGLIGEPVQRSQGKAKAIAEASDFNSLFDSQIMNAIASLEANPDLDAVSRIEALNKIMMAQKARQSVALQAHLKSADASIFAALVRRYEPSASDDRVIEVYREIVEELKIAGAK